MSNYVRPQLPSEVYYDAGGNIIDYGSRWRGRPGRMPPEDTYSVVTNPGRFAPLQTIADALIQHLVENYDVAVDDSPSVAADVARPGLEVLRAVRLTPSDPDSAPLIFGFTAFPGLIIRAGLLHDFHVPQCGCDACDDSIEGSADEMERLVMAVVSGGYRERAGGYELRNEDPAYFIRARADQPPRPSEAMTAKIQRLEQVVNGWQQWPRRHL